MKVKRIVMVYISFITTLVEVIVLYEVLSTKNIMDTTSVLIEELR